MTDKMRVLERTLHEAIGAKMLALGMAPSCDTVLSIAHAVMAALSTKQEEPPPNDAREAAHRVRNCDYGMVDEDDARLVAFAYISTKQEAGEVGYAPPIGTGKKPHGVVTVEAGEVSRSQTAAALRIVERHYRDAVAPREAKALFNALQEIRALPLPVPDGSSAAAAAPFDQATQEPAASHAAIFVLFVAKQFEEFCDDPMEGWQEMAEAFGIVEQVEFDPAKHQDPHGMFTEGDTMFVLTEQAKHAIHAARDGAVANASERVATPLPVPDAGWRTVQCRWCYGRGHVSGDPEGAPVEDCDVCGGTKRIQIRARPLPAPPVGDGSSLA